MRTFAIRNRVGKYSGHPVETLHATSLREPKTKLPTKQNTHRQQIDAMPTISTFYK